MAGRVPRPAHTGSPEQQKSYTQTELREQGPEDSRAASAKSTQTSVTSAGARHGPG
ncbi:hypothetical protein [Streptomyces sp. BE133]|uniref:hypothetical protein n=1 Tax=Streptomyces sp. BE133 TaxID=3002523 RepID=UPI002E787B01|nr:hypothetical protein [Streptomyces sp. BE133]MEE1808926.1 hypothetical protein [Streptomyces sp. BE133]